MLFQLFSLAALASSTLISSVDASPVASTTTHSLEPRWIPWQFTDYEPFICYPVFEGNIVQACDCKPYRSYDRDEKKLVHKRIWPLSDGCTVRRDRLPDAIGPGGGVTCCESACDAWCGDACIIKSQETCQSGFPVEKNPGSRKVRLPDGVIVPLRKRGDTCPMGKEACFVGAQPGDEEYECIDTQNDLENCGGCASQDPLVPRTLGDLANASTRDCTLIPNAAAVGCSAGKCTVSKCDPGFAIVSGPSGDHCARNEQESLKLQKYRLD